MIFTTKAIVLSAFPYNETSLITRLYTKEFGLRGYIIKGIRKKSSPLSVSIFQPLQLIEAEVYNNNHQSLQVLRNASIIDSVANIRSCIVKSSLTFFLSEIIGLSIKEDNPDEAIFDFIEHKIEQLNAAEKNCLKDFHTEFMVEFASYLGFDLTNYKLPKTFLNDLINFYEQHIIHGKKIQSHVILHTILH